MSLVTLTFGYGKQNFSVPPMMHISHPKDHIKIDPDSENKLEVLKIVTFYKNPELYIVGRVISGAVKEDMQCTFRGQEIGISCFDSHLKGIGKQGMVVGFNIQGISKKELSKGDVLEFSLS